MEELFYSGVCIAALIVLPTLFFMLHSVRKMNRSLSIRVERLESAVVELQQGIPGESTQSAAASLSTLEADQPEIPNNLLLNEDEQTSIQAIPDALIDGSPSTSQSSEALPQSSFLKGISSAHAVPVEVAPSYKADESKPRSSMLSPLFGWFAKMHLMVQIGILILFIGIAFLIKFVADQGLLSIELRLLTSALFGIGLSAIGWRLRNRVRTYGMALMGGGLAIAYLTTYGAILYAAFPSTLAFPIFVILGILGGLLAVVTNAWILAFLAIVGAFLAPILASSGQGSHVTLFSYYAVVNAGILAIAWFKTWRSLNLIGYFFTMVVGLFWGLNSYTPELFRGIEFFLILFYGFYVLIAVLFAARRSTEITAEIAENPNRKLTGHDAIDVTLIFGNPLVAFSIQSYLMQDVRYGMALSTFVAGIMYAALAVLFVMKRREARWSGFRVVAESFLFLAGLFIALTVPLTFELQVTAAIWAVMGLAWVWAGSNRSRWWQIVWGGLIQLGAAAAVLVNTDVFNLFNQAAFVNGPYLNALLISLSAYGSGYLLNRARLFKQEIASTTASASTLETSADTDVDTLSEEPAEELPKDLPETKRAVDWLQLTSWVATLWGHMWWFSSGLIQVVDFVQERDSFPYWVATSLAFIALSTGAIEWAGRQLRWSAIRLPGVLLLPILMVGALAQAGVVDWPLAGGGWYAWPIGLAVVYWVLYGWDRFEADPWAIKIRRLSGFHHVGSLWLVVGLFMWIGIYGIQQWTDARNWPEDGWIALVALGIPTLVSWLLLNHGDRLAWPIGKRLSLYKRWGAGPLLGLAMLFNMGVNTTIGAAAPLPYLPILNPLDLVQIAFFVVVFQWVSRTFSDTKLNGIRQVGYWIAGIAAFLTFNAGLARAVHHLLGNPFEVGLMVNSSTLQTLYAVSWSALAMVLMFLSHRRGEGWRSVWIAGAIVLGLTVLKLFTIDLANSGTIARIISFMGTGVLILVIAYFAPAPPLREKDEADNDDSAEPTITEPIAESEME